MGEADFRAIVELIDDGVAVVRRGKTLYCTPGWARRLGQGGDQSYLDFVVPEDRERVMRLYQQKLAEYEGADPARSTPLRFDVTLQTAAGEQVETEVTTHLLQLEDGPATVLVLRDVTAQKATARALRQSEERYRLLSELTSDFSFALRLNEQGELRTEWVAGAYSQITGYEIGEIWDRGGWVALIHPEDRSHARREIQRALQGEVSASELRFVTKQDETRWVRAFIRPLCDDDGKVVGVIGAGHDRTERRLAEQALEQSNDRLREANRQLEKLHRAKDEVTATVSHELRTPLVTGLGYVEMLLSGAGGELPRAATRRLSKARHSLLRLRGLIDGLLQYNSFLAADASGSQPATRLELTQLARQTASEFLVGSKIPGDRLELRVPDAPVEVLAQPEPMRIVLANLLNNAASHAGDDARITLEVTPVQQGQVRVTVSDNGDGIPREMQGQVWNLFTRARKDRPGLGLGLAIVQAVLKSHHTEPRMESSPGQGTRIWFELPAAG